MGNYFCALVFLSNNEWYFPLNEQEGEKKTLKNVPSLIYAYHCRLGKMFCLNVHTWKIGQIYNEKARKLFSLILEIFMYV